MVRYPNISIAELVALYESFESTHRIGGLALGPKITDQETIGDEPTLAFFVPRKRRFKGRKRTLSDGTRLVPKSIVMDKARMRTDVLETRVGAVSHDEAPTIKGALGAGRPVSNRSASGTVAMIGGVSTDPDIRIAITNRHVALSTGSQVFFPARGAPSLILATTGPTLDLVPAEEFFGPVGRADAYFDVDAAVVPLPPESAASFDPSIPQLGRPTGMFEADTSSVAAYHQSLVGVEVDSWGWMSNLRQGKITHVLYATRLQSGRPVVMYSMLIGSRDGKPPGITKDSGKAWVTRRGIDVLLVGLHQGITTLARQPRAYAVATDFAAVARLLHIHVP